MDRKDCSKELKVILINTPEGGNKILEEFGEFLEKYTWVFLQKTREEFAKFHWEVKTLDECDPVRPLLKLPVVKLKKELRKTQKPVKHWQHLNTAYKQGRHLK